MLTVLYEDNHLLVVEKPVNVPVQADATGDDDVLSILKRYIRDTYHKPGEVYLALVHRLDRPVGGVMVFAKTSKAAARLTAQFKSHEAKKRYAAIVDGCPPAGQTLTDWLLKDEKTFSSAVVPSGTPNAKEAKLSYTRLADNGRSALLDVTLYTGRPHQIRVQLMHAGWPIHGDQRYNPSAVPGEQISLWAYALSVKHPTLGEEMTFFSAPRGDAFSCFPAAVKCLPAFSVCRGVYEDDDKLVVDKNAFVEVETDLVSELNSLYPEIYPVHRLDANTEGLVLLAKNRQEETRLTEKFRAHDLTKIYRAIVIGTPAKSGTLVHYGQKDAENAVMRIVPEGTKNAQKMVLTYTLLETDGERSLLEISLGTGRTHQIRAQFAAIGHPLLGDDRYGDRAMNKRFHAKRQQLLAKRLILDGQTFESCRELTL